MCDYMYQEKVTTGQTDTQTEAGQSCPYVPVCFTGNTKTMDLHFIDKNSVKMENLTYILQQKGK